MFRHDQYNVGEKEAGLETVTNTVPRTGWQDWTLVLTLSKLHPAPDDLIHGREQFEGLRGVAPLHTDRHCHLYLLRPTSSPGSSSNCC